MRWIIMLILLPFVVNAQVSDNFSDGNFTSNPVWAGDTAYFNIDTAEYLHSDGPNASSTIYLITANNSIDSTEWEFLIRLDFNPSSTNFVRVYLVSDQPNLAGSLNGYFVQFGEPGTNPDSLDVFRQDGLTVTKIFTGTTGCMTSSTTNSVRVKILRNNSGNWNVYADCAGGNNFSFEGNFSDNTHSATNQFGVYCKYSTASRKDKYLFDDFYVGDIIGDTITATVQSVNVISSTQLDVFFTEPVEQLSAEDESFYSVDNGIGNPQSAIRDAGVFSVVHLDFSNSFNNGINYLLSVSGVVDLIGNITIDSENFVLYNPQPEDVIINEIFADPTPLIGLPDHEFVELYNNTAFDIPLDGWIFSDTSSMVVLPNIILPSNNHLILCSTTAEPFYSIYGATTAFSSLPSLNNTGDILSLRSPDGTLIDRVSYSDAWYQNDLKDDGGWSLELIDPSNPCNTSANWIASDDPDGGTPGEVNSVLGFYPDTIGPSITQVFVLANNQIIISLSETLDSTEAENVNHYSINNTIGNPVDAIPVAPDFTQVQLILGDVLDSNTIYSITLSGLIDCTGNVVGIPNSATFAIPHEAERYDIVFNELLPDPDPQIDLPASEYVELFNRSNKAIDLNGWKFEDASSSVTIGNYLLLPDSFVVIYEDAYENEFASITNRISVTSLPSLNNDFDSLYIFDDNNELIDFVLYDDSWYRNAQKADGGYSLEKINPENYCQAQENWNASTDLSGGTPGRKNSVFANATDVTPPDLLYALVPDAFTIELIFSESVDSLSAADVSNYSIDQSIGNPLLAQPVSPFFKKVILSLLSQLQTQTVYNIAVSNLSDCSGNEIGVMNAAQFGVPEPADSLDIIINEVMFNPATGGVDFVEVYNNSPKIISLKNIFVSEGDVVVEDSLLENSRIASVDFLILPQQFICLTSDPEIVKQQYYTPEPNNFIAMNDFPNYPDDESVVILRDGSGNIFDKLHYSNNWHFALLDNEEGVSLERIFYDYPTQHQDNWQSAASTVEFATPAYQNSQFSDGIIQQGEITISPEVFSPDGDGYDDVLNIQYQFPDGGYVANATIYDSEGRAVIDLVQSELLGTEGSFKWDGVDEFGEKSRIGIYILYFEAFKLDGTMSQFKKTFVLAGKF